MEVSEVLRVNADAINLVLVEEGARPTKTGRSE